jgi:urease accessory protein
MRLRAKSTVVVSGAFLLLLSPTALFAHPMQGVGDFYAGMLHPLTAIEWALPMVALSFLAGQQGREVSLSVLAVFPAALAAGAIAGYLSPVTVPTEIATVGLMALLGLLVAWAGSIPLKVSVALAALVGFAVGFANGSDLTPATSVWRFIPGLSLVGLMLITYGVGLIRWLKAPWTKIGIRVLGSWIAAVGILILGLRH